MTKNQQLPHISVDALLQMWQLGQFDEKSDSVPLADRFNDRTEVRRGSAKTERRSSAIHFHLDTELILGAYHDLTARCRAALAPGLESTSSWRPNGSLSRHNAEYLFSFPSICARLELDAKFMAGETLRRLDWRRVDLIRKHFERFSLEWLAEPPAFTERKEPCLPNGRPAVQSTSPDVVSPEALEPGALPAAA